jgi:hypothetical protein
MVTFGVPAVQVAPRAPGAAAPAIRSPLKAIFKAETGRFRALTVMIAPWTISVELAGMLRHSRLARKSVDVTKARKQFFFEKKNQKTFICFGNIAAHH